MRGTALDTMGGCFKGDDHYYLRHMKSILEAFPNKGPPLYPVQLNHHLYIGNQRNADDVEGLRRLGITHVLNCAGTRRFDLSKSPYPSSSGIKGYLMISAEDHDHYDIMKDFPDAIYFLDNCRSKGGKAFVHCNLGVNRSGAICAAYIMIYEQKPLLEVISFLKDKRQFILCNKNFRRQLIRFARCKGLLDNIVQTQDGPDLPHNSISPRTEKDKIDTATNQNGYYPTTQSLDRKSIMRINHLDISDKNGRSETAYSNYLLPRQSRYGSAQNLRNGTPRYDSENGSKYQLESVPERKPICDFIPTRPKYDKDFRIDNNGTVVNGSAPSTPKSVTFRRPTVSDVMEDNRRVRSGSASPTTKLKFLSKLGSKLTRQSSLTNVSQSSLDETPIQNGGAEAVVVSTTRPLRVYKRASSDTEVYCRGAAAPSFRRADTLASADLGLEKTVYKPREEQHQEYTRYHSIDFRNSSLSNRNKETSHSGSSGSLNLLARLRPVSKSKSNR